MSYFLRTISAALLSLPLVLGCSGGGDQGGQGGAGTTSANATSGAGPTTGAGTTGAGAGGASSTTSGGNTSAGPTTGSGMDPFTWPGTWNVALEYTVDCDYSFGNVKHANITQTNAMKLTDDGSGGIAADITGFLMAGTGDAASLTLSGQYPVKDEGMNVAGNVQANTNIALSIDVVTDNKHASGAISGTFTGNFGQKCTIAMGGKATLSR